VFCSRIVDDYLVVVVSVVDYLDDVVVTCDGGGVSFVVELMLLS